jgi:serine/alanine adding enzyme
MPKKELHVIINPSDPRWMDLVYSSAEANIFHHPAWIELLTKSFEDPTFIFAIPDEQGRLAAGTPIAEMGKLFSKRRWVALPFSEYCVPLYRSITSLNQLKDELTKTALKRSGPRIEIRYNLPASVFIQTQSRYYRHTLRLNEDIEQVIKQFSPRQMAHIRSLEKDGFYVASGTSLKEVKTFYKLHISTTKRQGIPVQPWSFFEHLAHNLIEQRLGYVLTAYNKEKGCVAAGVFLYWNKKLTCKYIATDAAWQHLHPELLLIWTAISWGCANGYEFFDFGRTDDGDDEQLAMKRQWGAEETRLTYSYIASPQQNKLPQNTWLSNLGQAFIRRSPDWVCRVIGWFQHRIFK